MSFGTCPLFQARFILLLINFDFHIQHLVKPYPKEIKKHAEAWI